MTTNHPSPLLNRIKRTSTRRRRPRRRSLHRPPTDGLRPAIMTSRNPPRKSNHLPDHYITEFIASKMFESPSMAVSSNSINQNNAGPGKPIIDHRVILLLFQVGLINYSVSIPCERFESKLLLIYSSKSPETILSAD